MLRTNKDINLSVDAKGFFETVTFQDVQRAITTTGRSKMGYLFFVTTPSTHLSLLTAQLKPLGYTVFDRC